MLSYQTMHRIGQRYDVTVDVLQKQCVNSQIQTVPYTHFIIIQSYWMHMTNKPLKLSIYPSILCTFHT